MLDTSRAGALSALSLILLNVAFAQNSVPTPPAKSVGQIATPAATTVPSIPTDPAAILVVGSELNGLNGPGISPWHIKATYQEFDTNGKFSGSGSYEEFWFSDKSYKRTYTSPTFTQTDYATEQGLYRSGSQDWPGGQETEVRMYLTAPIPTQLGLPNPQLTRQNLAVGPEHLQCVTLKSTQVLPVESAYCFEQDRPVLRLTLSSDGLSENVYNSVVEFQGHFIARDILVTFRNKPVLTIHIDEIGTLSTTGAESEFAPSSDAAGPIAGKITVPEGTMGALRLVHMFPVYPVSAKEMHVEGTVILHITVGKDGVVKSADAISGPKPLRMTAVDAVRQWKYRPFLFLGDPAEVETNVRITFTLIN